MQFSPPQLSLFLVLLLERYEARHGRIKRGVHGLVIERALLLLGLEVDGAEALDLFLKIDALRVQFRLDRVHAVRVDFLRPSPRLRSRS